MPRLKLGLVLESLNLPLKQALTIAPSLGVVGVQVDAVGDLAPDALGHTGRREFRHWLRARDLELAALGCPLRHGFNVLDHQEARIAHVRKVLSLAYDLGARSVVVFAGALPPADDPARTWMTDSLTVLGQHGDRVGATLALAAGMEPPAMLAAYVHSFRSGGLGVHLDPAGLLMRGIDPPEAVREFRELIVHTHARDARPDRPDRSAQEVPLGHGEIDWTAYLGALEEVGYQGWLTIRRGPCPDPAGEIKAGTAFLRRLVG